MAKLLFNLIQSTLIIFMFIFVLRFVIVAKILWELLIMGDIAWLGGKSFVKQFYFKFDPVTEVIADNKDGLKYNAIVKWLWRHPPLPTELL